MVTNTLFKHLVLFFMLTILGNHLLGKTTILESEISTTQTDFITTWQTTIANETILIPTNSIYTYNYTIDWGDGTIETGQTGNSTHDYLTPGIQTITISGIFPHFYGNNWLSRNKLLTVEQWGNQPWQDMNNAFRGCENLNFTATDVPDLSNVNNMSRMFNGATNFDSPLNDWDVSGITDMSQLFSGAIKFNQPLNNWVVDNVTTMAYIFNNTPMFNQPLDSWNVSNVLDMTRMFGFATAFDQPLNNWNVSGVVVMEQMFNRATSFNQPLDSWNVSSAINMSFMFNTAYAFNQSLETWDVSNVSFMTSMLDDCGMDITNYDNTLIGWLSFSTQFQSRIFGATNLTYCTGASARQSLIDDHGWNFFSSNDNLDQNCINGCLPNLNISNIPNGINYSYSATQTITSDATVLQGTGTDITYEAGDYIDLQTNFEVEVGALFEARIGGCGN